MVDSAIGRLWAALGELGTGKSVLIMDDKGASLQEPDPLWDALGSGPDFGCTKS